MQMYVRRHLYIEYAYIVRRCNVHTCRHTTYATLFRFEMKATFHLFISSLPQPFIRSCAASVAHLQGTPGGWNLPMLLPLFLPRRPSKKTGSLGESKLWATCRTVRVRLVHHVPEDATAMSIQQGANKRCCPQW